MKPLTTTLFSFFLLSLLLNSELLAECKYELFSISSTKKTRIIDFVDQLSDECKFSIILTDKFAKDILNKKLNKTHLKNLTINEVFDIILKENNLSYTLQNDILKISYLTTKVFNIDYILSQRKGVGSTDITLSSQRSSDATTGTSSNNKNDNSQSGIKIENSDEVKFWQELDSEFQSILNRPEDPYIANKPIINKNAGLITVTATAKQMKRFSNYIEKLQKKVKLQVLIDVQLLSVTISDSKTTGIDWQQLYALQNVAITTDLGYQKNSFDSFGDFKNNISGLVDMKMSASLNQVIKFLQTQGDVTAISNPKVLTLNNQPALITAGTEYFYKIISTETLASSNTAGTQSSNEEIQSVFAGVLLSITPEISDDDTITLIINPSLSETNTDISLTSSENRNMPPDLNRRQLSSVVTLKDGEQVILGGLINTKNTIQSNKIPILGDIPLLNYFFSYKERVKSTQELVMIIKPHIIKKVSHSLSLSDLGYSNIDINSSKIR
jgi:general secretion pathway protein D